MNITVWSNFTKRKNSTKIPSGGGTTIDCFLKADTSVENPHFILNMPVPDYTYVYAFGSYYFVNDLINLSNNRCELICTMDALGTFRNDILNYTAFVERAASNYDVFVNDPLLSMRQLYLRDTLNITPLDDFFDTYAGCFITQVLAKDIGVALYATFNLEPFNYILTPSIYTQQNTREWIESRVAQSFDLDVYIGSVKWMPFNPREIGTQLIDTFPIGPVDIAASVNGGSVPEVSQWPNNVWLVSQSTAGTKHKQYTLNLPSNNNFNDFRDCNNDFTSYNLFLPGVGVVPMDASVVGHAVHNNKHIYVDVYVDLVTGEITYILSFEHTPSGGGSAIIGRYTGNVSVDVPIGKSSADAYQQGKTMVTSSMSGAMTGFWAGTAISGLGGPAGAAIGAGVGLIGGAVEAIHNGLTPGATMIGGSGNKTELFFMRNNILLSRKQFGAKEFPTSVAGRPLMQNVLLSTLSGYVKCGNASVPINGRDKEREEINMYLNTGFYIE